MINTFVTWHSSRVSRRPRGLAADAAAALPWAGSLALAALDRAPYPPDAWKGKRYVHLFTENKHFSNNRPRWAAVNASVIFKR